MERLIRGVKTEAYKSKWEPGEEKLGREKYAKINNDKLIAELLWKR